jgi:hypothetical protein
MARPVKITIPCPQRVGDDICGKALTLELVPYMPATRLDPPEGGGIDDVYGCEHADAIDHADLYSALEELER